MMELALWAVPAIVAGLAVLIVLRGHARAARLRREAFRDLAANIAKLGKR